MAYPRYIQKSVFASGTGALTVGAVSETKAGDIIILFVESANQTINTPTGYSVLATQIGTGTAAAAGGVRIATFYRILEDAADTSTTVDDSGDHTTAIKMAFRDTSLADGAFFVTATSTQAATTAMVFPAVTTATDESFVVLAVAQDTDVASSATVGAVTNANLTNITERHDQTVIAGAGGGLAVITGRKATAGDTGTSTATGSTSVTHAYHTISLSRVAAQTTTSTFNTVAGTSYFPISDAMRITAGPSGSIAATSSGTFQPSTLTNGTYEQNFKWYWRQLGTDFAWTTSTAVVQTTGAVVSGGVLTTTGAFTDNETITGLTNGVEYEFVLFSARASATPANTISFSATAKIALRTIVVADPAAYSFTGNAANTLFNRNVEADQGSFALAGTDATFSIGAAPNNYSITADSVAFALTRTDANLNNNRVLGADTVSFALTGQAAGLARGYVMPADTLSCVLSGTDAGLRVNRVIVAASGSFNESVTDAGLLYGYAVTADSVSFTLTGTDAALVKASPGSLTLIADSAAYSVVGNDASQLYGRNLGADPSTYALVGTDAVLSKSGLGSYTLSVDSGSFALAGSDATLLASGDQATVVRGRVRFDEAMTEWEARRDFRKQAVQIIERLDEAPQEAPVTVEAVAEVAPRFSLVEAMSEGVELGLDIDPILLALQARNAMQAEQNAMSLMEAIEQEREAIALAWFMAEAA